MSADPTDGRNALRAEVSALRAALERIAEMESEGQGHDTDHDYCGICEAGGIARDALGRYPKEASDG